MASHLHQRSQLARLLGLYRQRSAARRRHALPHARQISLARNADDLSVLGRGCRASSRGRHGDEDGEVHHRAVAGIGGIAQPLVCPQVSSQSAPEASTTRPSASKNLLGIWKIASIKPPSGHHATCRLPASRQTNSPALHSIPCAGPSLSTRLPSST